MDALKVGELFKGNTETVADIVARELPAAHLAFAGRGLSDVEVLALAVSQQSRLVAEFRPFAEAAQTARIQAAMDGDRVKRATA